MICVPAKVKHRASKASPRRAGRSMKRRSAAPLQPSRHSRNAVEGSIGRKQQPLRKLQSDAAAMEKAGAALAAAEREHDKIVASIEKDREAVDRRAAAEEERWEKAKDRLERLLRNASR